MFRRIIDTCNQEWAGKYLYYLVNIVNGKYDNLINQAYKAEVNEYLADNLDGQDFVNFHNADVYVCNIYAWKALFLIGIDVNDWEVYNCFRDTMNDQINNRLVHAFQHRICKYNRTLRAKLDKAEAEKKRQEQEEFEEYLWQMQNKMMGY